MKNLYRWYWQVAFSKIFLSLTFQVFIGTNKPVSRCVIVLWVVKLNVEIILKCFEQEVEAKARGQVSRATTNLLSLGAVLGCENPGGLKILTGRGFTRKWYRASRDSWRSNHGTQGIATSWDAFVVLFFLKHNKSSTKKPTIPHPLN